MVNFSHDSTGDGWPDIVASGFENNNRPIDLYVNPKGESRLWDRYRVLPSINSELVANRNFCSEAVGFTRVGDINSDGRPDFVSRRRMPAA